MYTIYTKPNCVFCDQAKALLRTRSLPFQEIKLVQEINVSSNHAPEMLLEHFKARFPDQRTVPLILKDGMQVGGFSELKASLSILLG
jgi:glutaredoxin 3